MYYKKWISKSGSASTRKHFAKPISRPSAVVVAHNETYNGEPAGSWNFKDSGIFSYRSIVCKKQGPMPKMLKAREAIHSNTWKRGMDGEWNEMDTKWGTVWVGTDWMLPEWWESDKYVEVCSYWVTLENNTQNEHYPKIYNMYYSAYSKW